MTSERFRKALKDLKDVHVQGGLAQDDTIDKQYETVVALAARIYDIGFKEGLTKQFITKEIEDHVYML